MLPSPAKFPQGVNALSLKLEIGNELYLFRIDPKDFVKQLVISAHGGYDDSTPHFSVPAYPGFQGLRFYTTHGTVQMDMGIGGFAAGDRAVTDDIGPGANCWDYALSKYQGRHSSGAETYDSIGRDLEATVEKLWKYARGMASSSPGIRKVYQQKGMPQIFDVLTIRNRFWMGDLSLSKVLKRVMKVHAYQQVHCYFCRSKME
jgi:hypothetical protein